jgi:Na+-driven multidrug efflux pump
MVLDTAWLAALTAFFNFIAMMDCFSYGFGFATTSMMTKYLVNGQVHRAKVVAAWSMAIVILLAIVISVVISFFPEEMANIFLKTDGAKSVSTDARDKLKTLFEIFPWILPVEIVLGEMVAYVRALGQAKIFIITQVLVLYLIHFLVMWLLLWNTDLQG